MTGLSDMQVQDILPNLIWPQELRYFREREEREGLRGAFATDSLLGLFA